MILRLFGKELKQGQQIFLEEISFSIGHVVK